MRIPIEIWKNIILAFLLYEEYVKLKKISKIFWESDIPKIYSLTPLFLTNNIVCKQIQTKKKMISQGKFVFEYKNELFYQSLKHDILLNWCNGKSRNVNPMNHHIYKVTSDCASIVLGNLAFIIDKFYIFYLRFKKYEERRLEPLCLAPLPSIPIQLHFDKYLFVLYTHDLFKICILSGLIIKNISFAFKAKSLCIEHDTIQIVSTTGKVFVEVSGYCFLNEKK